MTATAIKETIRMGSQDDRPIEIASTHPAQSGQAGKQRPRRQSGAKRSATADLDEARARRAERRRKLASGLDWPIVLWIVGLHIGALWAPWTFSWQGLVVMLVLGWISGGIGICLGFHRLLSHGSFTTYRPIRWLIALLGGLAGQGSAVHWAANHRKHHALSDQVGDPHSPRDGAWWSHVFWFMPAIRGEAYAKYNRRWAPDLMKDPVLRFLDKTFLLWHFALGALLMWLGTMWGGSQLAWSFLVWGMFVRLVYVLHCTWLVNSATHMWGYRNFETNDDSRNLWWVALLTYGEGWHNNHHAHPRRASFRHHWWELDVTYTTICLLERLGLVWNVAGSQSRRSPSATKR